MALNSKKFDEFIIGCQKCPRLVEYASETKLNKRKYGFGINDYWCRPVPSFGNLEAHVLIIGLAPGRHGAGRTGRPFTGDYAGDILYRALHESGFSSSKKALSIDDGLELYGVRIANAVRCAPPQNKPLQEEILNCRPYLIQEIEMMGNLKFVLALGNLAHNQLISSMGLRQTDYKFGHETIHTLPDQDWKLMNSYHPSRYNINTKRLTYQMFLEVIQKLTH
jgi:uracil-DNA glycosylase family 4